MDRLRNALGNFVTGFLTAFVVVSLLRDRQSGVRAGLAWGAISAVLSWVVAAKLGDLDRFEESASERSVGGTGTSD